MGSRRVPWREEEGDVVDVPASANGGTSGRRSRGDDTSETATVGVLLLCRRW